MGEFGENMPCGKALSELLAIERRAQKMSLEREVLPDPAEAREKSLRALGVTKSAHAPLTFTRRLMAILRPVVHPAAALTNTCLTFARSGMSALAAG